MDLATKILVVIVGAVWAITGMLYSEGNFYWSHMFLTGCFLTVITILLYVFDHRTTKKNSENNVIETAHAVKLREFVDYQPEYFTSLYKDRPTAQADKLFQAYKGKWLKVSGTFEDAFLHDTGSTPWAQIMIDLPSKVFVSAVSGDRVFMEYAQTLQKNEVITIVGQLENADIRKVRLSNCEIDL